MSQARLVNGECGVNFLKIKQKASLRVKERLLKLPNIFCQKELKFTPTLITDFKSSQ